MSFCSFTVVFTLCLFCFCSLIDSQQDYVQSAPGSCTHTGYSVQGYTCNGVSRNCQAYLIFRSQPAYNSIASISELLNSEQSQLSRINDVSVNATIDTNKMVIVPVNCSCSGEYYQANTSYHVKPGDTYFFISNNTFQGLSSCEALRTQNGGGILLADTSVTVPLRCACPTKNQSDAGIKYLLSYDVASGDSYEEISDKFDVDNDLLLEANNVTSDVTIYPLTTLLVPLRNTPNSSVTLMPPPPPSPPAQPPVSIPDNGGGKTWVYVVVGVLAGTVVLVICGSIIYYAFVRKGRRQADSPIIADKFKEHEKPVEKNSEREPDDFSESLQNIAQTVKVFDFGELQSATEDFSPKYLIKGSVYRGTINGDMIAIKRMSGNVMNEVTLMKNTNHLNLIRLVGVCFHDGHWYLVHEYAANESLSEWIYHKHTDEKFLSWTQRIQIGLDVVTGLNYLHCFTTPPHVHMDVNSSNVLLDSDFRAKISNFSQARSAEGRQGQFTLTRHIVGTRGYLAPEYLDHGLVSPNLDIYAFGVLMLEVLTGKEVADVCAKENVDLSDFLNTKLEGQNSLEHFVDPSLQGNYPSELAVFMVKLIISCLKKNPAARLPINEIVQSMSKALEASVNWELSSTTGLDYQS